MVVPVAIGFGVGGDAPVGKTAHRP